MKTSRKQNNPDATMAARWPLASVKYILQLIAEHILPITIGHDYKYVQIDIYFCFVFQYVGYVLFINFIVKY